MKRKQPSQLKQFEKEMIECWHQAMGNETLPYGDSILQAGLFAERICRALHIRLHKKSSNLEFLKLIQLFRKNGVFDNQIESYLNHFRKDANQRRHNTTAFEKMYLDISRQKMMHILNWYIDYTKARISNPEIKKYSEKLAKNAASTFLNLQQTGVISEDEIYDKLPLNNQIGNYEFQNKDHIRRTPVYAGLLIDESGSMRYEKQKVIDGQNEAIKAIRDSLVCRKKSLHLIQQTFHEETTIINPLVLVDAKGNDQVTMLNGKNYNPFNRVTHLYDSLHQLVMLLTRESDYLRATKSRKPQISIGVMSDGFDYTSEHYKASDVKRLIDNLKNQGVLKSSVIIGWESEQFTRDHLISLKNDLGFDEYLSLDISDPKSIRSAFRFWSQMIEKLEV